ncbi:MAG: hypothetical protein PHY82_01175, partial [Lentisphaeria bacterium]|nr:hypothetical protein [Lentisphaeria bacterium]
SCLTLTLLARKWAPQYLLSSVAGLILMLSPLLCHYAFEIRPYMLELLHCTLAVYLVCCCEASWSRKKLLLFGLALAFSMASRYSSIFPAILCASFLAFKFFYHPENPNLFVIDEVKLTRFLFLFVPSFVIGTAIVVLMAAKQWQVATSSNAYHLMFLIYSNPSEVFNWFTALLWLPMLILLTMRLLPLKIFSELARKYDLFIGFVLALNILRILVDLGRFIPYSLMFRFNLPCHTLLVFSWVPLLLLFFEYCSLQPNRSACRKLLPPIILVAMVLGILYHSFFFTRNDPDPSVSYLQKLSIDPPPKILSAINIYPALRYSFEYGSLQDRPHWRDHIYFYGNQYPKQKDWSVKKKFAFIASGGEMNEVYYRLAQYKHFNLILESRNYLLGGTSKRPGLSTVIVKLD